MRKDEEMSSNLGKKNFYRVEDEFSLEAMGSVN